MANKFDKKDEQELVLEDTPESILALGLLDAPEDSFCSKCQGCYRADHKFNNKFFPICEGTIDLQMSRMTTEDYISMGLDSDEVQYYETMRDPVSFTELMFKMSLRWYQKEMVLCLQGEEKVFMSNGQIKNIKDIVIGDMVVTYDKTGRRFFNHKVTDSFKSGHKDVYKIDLENGDSIKCTDNHPILSYSRCGKLNLLHNCKSLKTEYRSVKDGLSVGDRVYVANEFNRFGDVDNDDLAKLLGYIATDGYVLSGRKNVVEFTNIRREYVDEFEELVKVLFPNSKIRRDFIPANTDKYEVNRKDTWKCYVIGGRDNRKLLDFLISIGVSGKENREMGCLDYAFTFSEKSLKHFINRSWSGDGSVHFNGKRSVLSLHGGNRDFLEKYRILLKKSGVITSHIYNGTGEDVNLTIKKSSDVERFFSFSGLIFGKEEDSKKCLDHSKVTNGNDRMTFKSSTRSKILSIEKIGTEDVYDITVDSVHNFIANGIIVHNCTSKLKVSRCGRRIGKTWAMCFRMMWQAFVNKGFKILVVAPTEAQVQLLFDTLDTIMNESPEYQSMVVKNTKKPFEVRLSNGSSIKGFTAGSKSGGGSNQIRGQDAHAIYIDEADYINESDYKAIFAILSSHVDCELWLSSTPKGTHDYFWKVCTDKSENYREFHYKSNVHPEWNARTEKILRAKYTPNDYSHEFDADFGEQEAGVFRHMDIDECIQDYSLASTTPTANGIYVAGVDWNGAKNGIHIVVCKYQGETGHLKLEKIMVVHEKEYTQLTAVQVIIDMNARWNPVAIYCDAGHGGTQIEVLKKYGSLHPNTQLHNKVKPIEMGGDSFIKDPYLQEDVKKKNKPFMVGLSQRKMEEHLYIFPREEDKDHVTGGRMGVVKQMRAFAVERISATGMPVYSQGEEHTLTAWMLATMAFMMECTDLARVTLNDKIAVIAQSTLGGNNDSEGRIIKTLIEKANTIKEVTKHNEPVEKGQEWIKTQNEQTKLGKPSGRHGDVGMDSIRKNRTRPPIRKSF